MQEAKKISPLILEETKTIKFFTWLFYVFFIVYDLSIYYIFPLYTNEGKVGLPEDGLGIFTYIAILGLLPIAYYYNKKGNPYIVKYIYLFGYLLIELVNSLLIYLTTDKPYGSGSAVELLFLFFSPIFVNKRYFWIVSICMVGKYLLLGGILQQTHVVIPIISNIILAAIAYFLLNRFLSYIKSLTTVHDELRQKEKLAVIGQMAAAIAHEIRNPLSSLRGFSQLQQERHPSTNSFYPIMIQEIDRINLIVNDLMYIGKPKNINFGKANIEEIIAYTLSITQYQAKNQNVSVETVMAGPLPPIECDSKQLKQVFINLIKNAIESMPNGGNIKIKVKVFNGDNMEISIEDEGVGIPEQNVVNLGDPFFTTKQDGTGLGLMVTNQIIMDHKGHITFENKQPNGTKVTVLLPIKQKQKK
jgi:signal transduction histidine kinase